jgi:hypothetical protein
MDPLWRLRRGATSGARLRCAPPEGCCRHRPDRARSGAPHGLHRSGGRWDRPPFQAAIRRAPSIDRLRTTVCPRCGADRHCAPPSQATIRRVCRLDRQGVAGVSDGDQMRVPSAIGSAPPSQATIRSVRSVGCGRSATPALAPPRPCFERGKTLGFEGKARGKRPCAPMSHGGARAVAADERGLCSSAATARKIPARMEQGSTGRDPRGRAPGSRSLPDACASECR